MVVKGSPHKNRLALLILLIGLPLVGDTLKNRSIKDVRVLSPDWIAVIIDTTAEVLEKRDLTFKDVLTKEKQNYDRDQKTGRKNWKYAQFKHQTSLAAQTTFRPKLLQTLSSKDNCEDYFALVDCVISCI